MRRLENEKAIGGNVFNGWALLVRKGNRVEWESGGHERRLSDLEKKRGDENRERPCNRRDPQGGGVSMDLCMKNAIYRRKEANKAMGVMR